MQRKRKNIGNFGRKPYQKKKIRNFSQVGFSRSEKNKEDNSRESSTSQRNLVKEKDFVRVLAFGGKGRRYEEGNALRK